MKKQLALALALALAPFAASADELSYNYFEVGAARVDIENVDDGDGYQLRGSVGFAQNFYAFGSYGSVDANNFDADLTESQLGLGFHHGVSDRTDFIGEIGYMRQELDVTGLASGTADGGRVSAGFRSMPTDTLEAWVKANYIDGGDFEGEFSGTFGAQLKLNKTWGLVGEIEAGQDMDKYLIALRASF